ncbi:MAG: hypothetical protein ACK40U_05280, partial [Fervidobacterium pennivorans]
IASEIGKLASKMKNETTSLRKEFDVMIQEMNEIPKLSETILKTLEQINNSLVNESSIIEELTAKGEEITAEIARLAELIHEEEIQ